MPCLGLKYTAETSHLISQVRLLIHAKAQVNVAKVNGSTPLFKAAQFNHVAILRILIGSQADLDAQFESGATALFAASMHGHDDCVAALLNAGADRSIRCNESYGGQTPLEMAQLTQSVSCVRMLRASAQMSPCRVPDVVQGEELVPAVESMQRHWLRFLLSLPGGALRVNDLMPPSPFAKQLGVDERFPILWLACSITMVNNGVDLNGVDIVKELLQRRANVSLGTEKRDLCALQAACSNTRPELVSLLLTHRADPNRQSARGDSLRSRRQFPLMATGSSSALSQKSNSQQRVLCARLLLEHGAKLDMVDGEGFTALTAFAEWGDVELCNVSVAITASPCL